MLGFIFAAMITGQFAKAVVWRWIFLIVVFCLLFMISNWEFSYVVLGYKLNDFSKFKGGFEKLGGFDDLKNTFEIGD